MRMPPARRGWSAYRQPMTRQTWVQMAVAGSSAQSQPECSVHEEFRRLSCLQVLVADAETAAVPLSAWEHSMERRFAVSGKMLHEIHTEVLEVRPTAAVAADSSAAWRPATCYPATSSSPAADGCVAGAGSTQ